MTIRFENSYAALPEHFYARIHPHKAANPELIRLNEPLAEQLQLDVEWLKSAAGVAMLCGSELPETSEPIAMAYAGHQFGGWVPQLGDGRAHLIGELVDKNGTRFDLHLKGSGQTPFSRRGDGKAALGPVLREYIVSEWFAAMGIPATRTLAAVLTGEEVYRETTLPGAVLTRVAQSHVRVGTFQYFAARDDLDGVRALADYLIERHFAELKSEPNPWLAMFREVALRQARLIAQWMGVGFIHGVMNTDNMQLAGETIDFGPCAFMDAFHPERVFSSIDTIGRYAWNRQPRIGKWNLARLAETLLPLIHTDQQQAIAQAEAVLVEYDAAFEAHYRAIFAAKLGLAQNSAGDGDNDAFIEQTLAAMADNQVDFTLFFRCLTGLAAGEGSAESVKELFSQPEQGEVWLAQWRQRLSEDQVTAMRKANPVYIPRNHRIEQAIGAAVAGDFAPFHTLVEVLSHPLEARPGCAGYELAPEPHEVVHETFCGT